MQLEQEAPNASLLRGKVAVVTGASSGIGRATALAFAGEGAKVVVANEAWTRARPRLAHPHDIERLMCTAVERWGD